VVRFIAVLFLSAAPLLAQPVATGTPLPLSETRYYEGVGRAFIRSNGAEPIVFWHLFSGGILRAGRISSRPRIGHPLAGAVNAVWTGSHFIAVIGGNHRLQSRIVDAGGKARGDDILIVDEPGLVSAIKIASNGRVVMVAYSTYHYPDPPDVRLVVIDAGGRPLGAPRIVVAGTDRYAIAGNGREFLLAASTGVSEIRTLRFDQDGTLVSEHSVPSHRASPLAIASDGERYLIWAGNDEGALLINADGSLQRSLTLTERDGDPVSAAWNGKRWVLATESRIIEIDRDAAAESSRETVRSLTDLACVRERCFAAFLPINHYEGFTEYYDPIAIQELPLAAHERQSMHSLQARRQRMLTAVSSNDATLVLWVDETQSHKTTLRGGIRRRDGRWREFDVPLTIPTRTDWAIAASDGKGFVVVMDRSVLLRFDSEGQLLSAKQFFSDYIYSIASNGRDYLLVFDFGTLRLLSPAGDLGDPITPDAPDYRGGWWIQDVAGDGEGFLTLWSLSVFCGIPESCGSNTLAAIRFGPKLELRGGGPPLAARSYSGRLIRTGKQSIALWGDDGSDTMMADVDVNGALRNVRKLDNGAREVRSTRFRSGAAILTSRKEVLFLDAEGRITDRASLASDVTTWTDHETEALIELPDGSLAHLFNAISPEPAIADAIRVMMSVTSDALPSRADAPPARVHFDGRTIFFDWDAPPQTVTGYRVEYRLDDGEWIEMERLFEPEDRSATFVSPPDAQSVALRVRAWNDAGLGAYSSGVVTLSTPRRRSTRH
jgi:hypothetical protein